MGRSVWKNVMTFVLVLVLTVSTVAFLSVATAAKAETAPARYSREVQASRGAQTAELSARVEEESGSSPLLNVGAFAVVIAVPLSFAAVRRRALRTKRS